jgi:tyrosyl-tRNA synthetase
MPLVTVPRAGRAASEVTRITDEPSVAQIVYPLIQTLDCWALDVDVAVGGTDQRHVFMLSRELLSKLERKAPIVLLHRLGMGLSSPKKMDASRKADRLPLYASAEEITEKITNAFCPANETKENPIFDYVKFFIFPRLRKPFCVEREAKHGGNLEYTTISDLERDFAAGNLHPQDLKRAAARELVNILAPIRTYFSQHPELLQTFKESDAKPLPVISSQEQTAPQGYLQDILLRQPLIEYAITKQQLNNAKVDSNS